MAKWNSLKISCFKKSMSFINKKLLSPKRCSAFKIPPPVPSGISSNENKIFSFGNTSSTCFLICSPRCETLIIISENPLLIK